MDKYNVYSQNAFFKSGIESILNGLMVPVDDLILNKVIITDSIENLLQCKVEDLKSHYVILFVKDHRYMSLINHYDFNITVTTLLMTDKVENVRRHLADFFCKMRRKINMDNNSRYTPHQVWLTDRELNILMLSCSGKTVDMIASKLTLLPKSVLNYRAAALKKLSLNLSSSLVRFMLSINKL